MRFFVPGGRSVTPLGLTWLIIPVVVFVGAERAVRATVDRVPQWYAAAERIAEAERVDVLFIGTSRVGAAVFTPAFEETVGQMTGRKVRALNLGRGAVTSAAHYLGLRNLLERHHENLRGVPVFLEAPGGLSAAEPWNAPWVATEQPWILTEVMRPRDLRGFWRARGAALEQKIYLSLRMLGARSSLVRRRERF